MQWRKVGTISFSVPSHEYKVDVHLNPTLPTTHKPQSVRGQVVIKEQWPGEKEKRNIAHLTYFGGPVTPDKEGSVHVIGTLTDYNMQWLKQYENSGTYYIVPY